MKKLALLFLVLPSIALSGCAYWVNDREQVLSLSGFHRQKADTPDQQAKLASLPAHEFVRTERDTKISYTWSDPVVCNCLWVGSDQNYEKYWTVLRSRSRPTDIHTSSYTPGGESWQAPVSHGFGLP
jgi:hypothetical protein